MRITESKLFLESGKGSLSLHSKTHLPFAVTAVILLARLTEPMTKRLKYRILADDGLEKSDVRGDAEAIICCLSNVGRRCEDGRAISSRSK